MLKKCQHSTTSSHVSVPKVAVRNKHIAGPGRKKTGKHFSSNAGIEIACSTPQCRHPKGMVAVPGRRPFIYISATVPPARYGVWF